MAVNVTSAAALHSALDRTLLRIGRSQRELHRIEAERDAELEAVSNRYAVRIARRRETILSLSRDLRDFCERHRHRLMPSGRKSLQTPIGAKVGFRTTVPSIVPLDGYSEDDVCRLLVAAHREDLLRVRQMPDRAAIRKLHGAGALTREDLRKLGLTLTEAREEFYFHTNHDGAHVV